MAAYLDGFKFPPFVVEGGEPGAVGELTLTRANCERAALPSKVAGLSLAPGDRVRLATSGGGGYGYEVDWASDDYAVFGDHPGEYAETDDDGDDGDDGDE